jgi:ABC-type oligopeptide transport system substrate-binding subunit
MANAITRLSLAVLTGGALSPVIGSAVPARSATHTLPILRLDYFAGNGGELAATLDPAYANRSADADTVQLTNAGLVRVLPSGKVVPDLATWTVRGNHLVYSFRIRVNARFSNGDIITAADAAYSLRRALSPATASDSGPAYLGAIKGASQYSHGESQDLGGVSVLSRRVLRIELSEPEADFLTLLAYPTADVLDARALTSSGAPVKMADRLTHVCNSNRGAGPFKFVCWHDRSDYGSSFYPVGQPPSYTLVPNPYYYGAPPKIKIVLPAIDSEEHAYRAYLNGKLDVTPIPPTSLGRWMGSSQYLQYPTATIGFLVPNVEMAPFDDAHCRRALAYGIDRQMLAQTVLPDIGEPIYDLVPTGVLGGDGAGSPHLDLTAARAELMQCARRADPVSLAYQADTPQLDTFYSAIIAMMKDLGFNARLDPHKPSSWPDCTSGNGALSHCHIQLAATIRERYHPDPRDYLDPLRCGARENIGGWCNTTFDRLLDRAALKWNPQSRAELYLQAQQRALGDSGLIPLLEHDAHQLIKPYVRGLAGTVVSPNLLPSNGDWSHVAVVKRPGK